MCMLLFSHAGIGQYLAILERVERTFRWEGELSPDVAGIMVIACRGQARSCTQDGSLQRLKTTEAPYLSVLPADSCGVSQ